MCAENCGVILLKAVYGGAGLDAPARRHEQFPLLKWSRAKARKELGVRKRIK